MSKLAIHGGTPVRTTSFPDWPIVDQTEVTMVTEVINSEKWGRYDGEVITRFEQAFAQYQDAAHTVAVANGTLALEVALRKLGEKGHGFSRWDECAGGSPHWMSDT